MFIIQNSFQKKNTCNFPITLILICFLLFTGNLYSQQNNSIEFTGGFARSQASGIGTILTLSTRVSGGFFITASTGYISFNNSAKEYNPYSLNEHLVPVSREKFIIPLEIGGSIEFGEQKFRPFIKFAIGYNYTEFIAYGLKKCSPNAAPNERPIVVSAFKTHIAASYGIGMGASYFINDYMKIGMNFMMHDVTNINKYIRIMAGVSYLI